MISVRRKYLDALESADSGLLLQFVGAGRRKDLGGGPEGRARVRDVVVRVRVLEMVDVEVDGDWVVVARWSCDRRRGLVREVGTRHWRERTRARAPIEREDAIDAV